MKKEIFKVSIIYLLLSIIFFLPLFYPEPKLFVAPDFGRSDIWNFNYPLKELLSESLKKGEFPLWSKNIGMGFPILAEGQIGEFQPLNILLFYIFPTAIAFNLSYIFIFLIAASGMYFFLKLLRINSAVSFFGGFLFAFSGYNIVQLPHINLLMAASFLPWVFIASFNLINNPKIISSIYLGIILSFQFLSGFPQMSFISILGASLFFFWKLKGQQKKLKLKILGLCLISILIFLGISSIQILPSLEFIQYSIRKSGLQFQDATNFPYPLKHIASLINPFIFGNPKFATYPRFSYNWGIFWENTIYIGILPLVFVAIALAKKKVFKKMFFWVFLILVSFILVLGKNSPLYLIYTILPFSLFRVPSRFLLLFTFALIIIAMHGMDNFFNNLSKRLKPIKIQLLLFLVILIGIINIFVVWKDYQPYGKSVDWLKPPEYAKYLKNDNSLSRISTFPFVGEKWNESFLKTGWIDTKPYLALHETLDANFNLIHQIPSFDAYASFYFTRLYLMKKFIQFDLDEKNRINIDPITAKIFNINSVSHIISTYKITNDEFMLVKENELNGIVPSKLYLYNNKKAFTRIRFVTNSKKAHTLNDLITVLSDDKDTLENSVVLEDIEPVKGEKPEYSVKLLEDDNNKLRFKIENNEPGYVVIADSYYPGWEVYVNNNQSTVLPANLNQKAIKLDRGVNEVSLSYNPKSLKIGKVIFLTTCILITIYLGVYLLIAKVKI